MITASSTVEQYEHIEATAVGYGATYSLRIGQEDVESCPHKYDIFRVIRTWEAARRSNAFPENIKKTDRPFLERDVLLIIGEKHSDGTRTPSDFVVAWTPDGRVQGGTAMGIRTARHMGIPVFNIAIQKELSTLRGVYASLRDGIIPDFQSLSRDIIWRNRR